jgi:site-specific recombinase XerC
VPDRLYRPVGLLLWNHGMRLLSAASIILYSWDLNRSLVVKYRSFLERLSLSAATINLHLSAIRRLADESAESGWLSPEHAIGIRRVKGVKRLGRKMGNWLTRNQAQELVNAASKNSLRGWRDGARLGLLLGCGLRHSEVVGLDLDQLQSREGHWVIVNLGGKGKRLQR